MLPRWGFSSKTDVDTANPEDGLLRCTLAATSDSQVSRQAQIRFSMIQKMLKDLQNQLVDNSLRAVVKGEAEVAGWGGCSGESATGVRTT